MRKISEEELKTILEDHRHWWREDCEGWVKAKLFLNQTSAPIDSENVQPEYTFL